MKLRVRIDTLTDAARFVYIISKVTKPEEHVYLTNGERLCIDARSFLGVIAAKEFGSLWCESEKDIYTAIKEFEVIE